MPDGLSYIRNIHNISNIFYLTNKCDKTNMIFYLPFHIYIYNIKFLGMLETD